MGLPEFKPNYQQATNDYDSNIKTSLIEGDAEAGQRDYSLNMPTAGYQVNLSGTSSETVSSSIDSLRGEDLSKDVVDIKPFKAEHKTQLDDDLTSSFGNDFKFPRIEGIDDVEEKPCAKNKSGVSFIGNALLGTTKAKDYNDQADDVLAETLDQDLQVAEDRKKKHEEALKAE